MPVTFIARQTLFTVRGETGMLPYPALPNRSWGVFAMDGEDLYLLHPDLSSLSALLARERRSLDDGDPADLARLFCLVVLNGRDATGHEVVRSPDDLRCFSQGRMRGYTVDEGALRSVESRIVPPSVSRTAGKGWTLEFTTVSGWMHDKNQLGIESFGISPEFDVSRSVRQILHERIFSQIPQVIY